MDLAQNTRTPEKTELKRLTNVWNMCVSKQFLPRWLAGESVTINEVCTGEYAAMTSLTNEVYAEKPMPFNP